MSSGDGGSLVGGAIRRAALVIEGLELVMDRIHSVVNRDGLIGKPNTRSTGWLATVSDDGRRSDRVPVRYDVGRSRARRHRDQAQEHNRERESSKCPSGNRRCKWPEGPHSAREYRGRNHTQSRTNFRSSTAKHIHLPSMSVRGMVENASIASP